MSVCKCKYIHVHTHLPISRARDTLGFLCEYMSACWVLQVYIVCMHLLLSICFRVELYIQVYIQSVCVCLCVHLCVSVCLAVKNLAFTHVSLEI